MNRTITCWKCDGTGELPQYAHIEGGRCFPCNGTGKLKALDVVKEIRTRLEDSVKKDNLKDLVKMPLRKEYWDSMGVLLNSNIEGAVKSHSAFVAIKTFDKFGEDLDILETDDAETIHDKWRQVMGKKYPRTYIPPYFDADPKYLEIFTESLRVTHNLLKKTKMTKWGEDISLHMSRRDKIKPPERAVSKEYGHNGKIDLPVIGDMNNPVYKKFMEKWQASVNKVISENEAVSKMIYEVQVPIFMWSEIDKKNLGTYGVLEGDRVIRLGKHQIDSSFTGNETEEEIEFKTSYWAKSFTETVVHEFAHAYHELTSNGKDFKGEQEDSSDFFSKWATEYKGTIGEFAEMYQEVVSIMTLTTNSKNIHDFVRTSYGLSSTLELFTTTMQELIHKPAEEGTIKRNVQDLFQKMILGGIM